MPSKTQRKIQFAGKRNIIVQYVPFYGWLSHSHTGWYVFDDREYYRTGVSEISDENMYGPYLSKRQAKNVAYRLAVGQAVK